MISIIFAFVFIFGLFFFGIRAVRAMNGKELWKVAKLLTYSAVCSILAVVFLITVVILF